MTEQEWHTATDPATMLLFLKERASPRKLRLFAVACFRRFPNLFPTRAGRQALDMAERYADEVVSFEDFWACLPGDCREFPADHLSQAFLAAVPLWFREAQTIASGDTGPSMRLAATLAHEAHMRARDPNAVLRAPAGEEFAAARAAWQTMVEAKVQEEVRQCHLLRDLFGNPFERVEIDTGALSSVCRDLASWIYEERGFQWLSVLADLLEQSGCTASWLLAHCRERGEHTRGCWALDLVRGQP